MAATKGGTPRPHMNCREFEARALMAAGPESKNLSWTLAAMVFWNRCWAWLTIHGSAPLFS
jgi:hypothetical protein